jgi:pilus assembly protein CpaB
MNPVRLLIILVAALSAIGLAVVMQRMMGGKPAAAPVAAAAPAAGKPMTQVLVAKRDLAIGARLTADDVAWQAWPTEAVNAAFITNGAAQPAPEGAEKAKAIATDVASDMIGGADPAKAVEGAIVRDPILVGEPITSRKIVRGGDGGYLSVVLAPGKRAMAVPITSETGVGGFILPGDRVDVLQTRDRVTPGGEEGASVGKMIVAETILQNVRVLALDQSTAADKDAKSIVAATATLEVGPLDAEALVKAKASGPVTLTLRAYTDLGGPTGVAPGQRPEDESLVRINRGGQTSNISVRQ